MYFFVSADTCGIPLASKLLTEGSKDEGSVEKDSASSEELFPTELLLWLKEMLGGQEGPPDRGFKPAPAFESLHPVALRANFRAESLKRSGTSIC